jgi:hypothetical protein
MTTTNRFESLASCVVGTAFGLLCLGGMGCASLPTTGAQANGEALGVYTGTVIEHHQVQEKVGEVEHKDAEGRSIGRSEVYANRTVTTEREVWYPTQGGQRIDDQDFFSIAGDKEAADKIQSYRESGITLNRIGLATLGAGVAAFVGGYAMMSSGAVKTDGSGGNSAMSGVGTGLFYGGMIAMPVGGILTWMGLARQSPERHPVEDVDRAMHDADRYNKGGSQGGNRPMQSHATSGSRSTQ